MFRTSNSTEGTSHTTPPTSSVTPGRRVSSLLVFERKLFPASRGAQKTTGFAGPQDLSDGLML